MRVAIVGAGWAGLAAAIELTDAGQEVTLFEAGRVPGGRARSVSLDGQSLDNGQHLLLGAYRETLKLLQRVGVPPEQVLLREPLALRNNQNFRLTLPRWPTPLNLAWGLLTARGLTLRDKMSAARWLRALQRKHFTLPVDQPVSDWLQQGRQSPNLCRTLWKPLCLAALNTPAERASAQRFANVLRDSLGSSRRADTDLLFPRLPLGEVFPEPACRWLVERGAALRFGQRVRQITPASNGIQVDGTTFDKLILAVAPQHLKALWPGITVATQFEPIATVYLRYPPQTALPSRLYGLQGGLGQWVIDRGQGWLAAIFSGHGDWETLPHDELADQVAAELGLGKPFSHRVICEKRATFACVPGYAALGCETRHPDVLIAGDHTDPEYPATLEGAVRSGLRAARRLLENPNPIPYPVEWVREIHLRNGRAITLRPIRPEDAELEQAFVCQLSEESRHQRFMEGVRELTPAMLARFTQIDYQREMALIATLADPTAPNGIRQIGVARYAADSAGETVEFALVVADDWQRAGLGYELMQALMACARQRGYRTMTGEVLSRNAGMFKLMDRLGFTTHPIPDDFSVRRVIKALDA